MISSPNNAINLHAPGNGIPGIDPKTSTVNQDFSLKDKVIVVTEWQHAPRQYYSQKMTSSG